FAQQGLWLRQQLNPTSSIYNIPIALRLRGALVVWSLQQSLRNLAGRHEILRTRFQIREGRPVQVIDPPGEIELPIIDLSDLAESFRDEQVRIVASEQAARHFDLERGPVWRAELLRLASKDHVLLLNIHHVASDGWSTGILIKEFTTLYEG